VVNALPLLADNRIQNTQGRENMLKTASFIEKSWRDHAHANDNKPASTVRGIPYIRNEVCSHSVAKKKSILFNNITSLNRSCQILKPTTHSKKPFNSSSFFNYILYFFVHFSIFWFRYKTSLINRDSTSLKGALSAVPVAHYTKVKATRTSGWWLAFI